MSFRVLVFPPCSHSSSGSSRAGAWRVSGPRLARQRRRPLGRSRSWRPARCWCASMRQPKARRARCPLLSRLQGRAAAGDRAQLPANDQSTQLIEPFSERDLVADFKLDLDAGPRPRFLMTTGSIGPDNAGWAPLYVFETTTSQLGVYRMQIQTTIGSRGTAALRASRGAFLRQGQRDQLLEP